MKRPSIADVATGLLTACALIVTGLLVRRELRPAEAQPASSPIRNVAEWRSYAAGGQRVGAEHSPVTIVEFADFQCPFCRESARLVNALIDSLGDRVSLVYRHYPLSAIHPFAMTAAIASECAARQGRFRAYHDRLFARQDSIGRLSWTLTALESGITDTVSFGRCLRDSASVMPRIRADQAAAAKLGVHGTPALLINDELFAGAPSEPELHDLVAHALQAVRQ
jgi:protein-disulfide isomerase